MANHFWLHPRPCQRVRAPGRGPPSARLPHRQDRLPAPNRAGVPLDCIHRDDRRFRHLGTGGVGIGSIGTLGLTGRAATAGDAFPVGRSEFVEAWISQFNILCCQYCLRSARVNHSLQTSDQALVPTIDAVCTSLRVALCRLVHLEPKCCPRGRYGYSCRPLALKAARITFRTADGLGPAE